MKKGIILKSILIGMALLLINSTKSYCAESGTVRMKVDGDTPWININVSESYDECISLNSTTSTLGTGNLKAHLTTDADWSAMAIFSVSQYGGARTNAPTWTTGNETGVRDVGGLYTMTTGISETAKKDSKPYLSGLFNENEDVKEYVTKWPKDIAQNNFVAFKDTARWLGTTLDYRSGAGISAKLGFFNCWLGWDSGIVSGQASDSTTFRPVVWNK